MTYEIPEIISWIHPIGVYKKLREGYRDQKKDISHILAASPESLETLASHVEGNILAAFNENTPFRALGRATYLFMHPFKSVESSDKIYTAYIQLLNAKKENPISSTTQ